MSFDIYLPFIASAIFGTLGVRVAARMRAAQAAWLLTCGAVVTSACGLCSLCLIAWALLARFPVVASIGDWSAAVVRRHDPVGLSVSIPAVVLLAFICVRVSRSLARHVRELARAYRAGRAFPAAVGELVVVADDTIDACALPGWPGRIVVSRRALSGLSAAERAAVLAHERSHLRHKHHLHHVAVTLAAAANPLLRAVPRATSFALERWADDDAVRCLKTPGAVATALCRASVGARTSRSQRMGRLAALRHPPRRGGWAVLALSAVAFLGLLFSSAEAMSDAGQLARHAESPATALVLHEARSPF
jgi:hypothetical protein